MRHLCLLLTATLGVMLGRPAATADAYAPPANYYSTATGVGATLKSQLHNIIDNHTVLSYGDARSILQVTDADPSDPGNILLAYDRRSLDVSGLFASGIPGWDSGDSWNREHVWPRSRGVDDTGADNSDLHNLRPSDPLVNEDRANFNFGGAFGQPYGLKNDGGGTAWYPGDADAGMVARQSFYMAVRYDGSDTQTSNIELINGDPASFGTTMGNLDRLIQWHYAAPPDDFERRRNDIIYDSHQHNRNPFIDRPEYVWSVFVGQQNDSRVTIAGGTTDADASASTLNVDLGSVLVGGFTSDTQQVTLNKAGDDGTYYEVRVTGGATSDHAGRYNAFTTGGTDTGVISVGFSPDTSTPGMKAGTVTIDNLDVTTVGGTGRGANDADDVITTQLAVLDHSNGSFDPLSDLNSITLDFGEVLQNTGHAGLSFNLYNLVSTAGFTADLELGRFIELGDTGVLSLDGLAGTVAAGAAHTVTATIDTAGAGGFNSTWYLTAGDPDLPGKTSEVLTINLTALVIAGLEGDYNADGLYNAPDIDELFANLGGAPDPYDLTGDLMVDQADIDRWVTALAGTAAGDADLDGDVDDFDLLTAIANYNGSTADGPQVSWALGNTDGDADIDDFDLIGMISNHTGSIVPTTEVPEPGTAIMLTLMVLTSACRRRRDPR